MSRRLAAVPAPAPRAIGYVRVSLAREEMISPQLQRTAIEDHCRRKGYQLLDVVEDLDVSGRSFARAGVQQVIGEVEQGRADVVVVWKWSRFGRDRKGWAVNLDRLEVVGGRLDSATEDVDTTTSTGRFTRGMLAEIAAWESERIGDSWREAHARRLAAGLPHDGRPRFGYLYMKASGYSPDPERAPYLLEVHRRFARGDSARSICRWLNGIEVRTTRGGPWEAIALYRLLDSGFGAGLLFSRESGGYLPGAHEAVVDDKLWRKVRQVRETGRRESPWSRAPAHTLSGLVRCGGCGAGMTVGRSRERNGTYRRMYRCRAYMTGRLCEGSGHVSADVLERHVRAWVDERAGKLEALAEVAELRTQAAAVARQDRAHWQRQVAKYDRQLVRLNRDRAEGLMDDDAAFVAAREEITGERAAALEQLAAAAGDVDTLAGSVRPLLLGLSKDWDRMSVQGRRDTLRQLLRKVKVNGLQSGRPRIVLVPIWEKDPDDS